MPSIQKLMMPICRTVYHYTIGGYGFVTFDRRQDAEMLLHKEGSKVVFKDRKLNFGPAVRKQAIQGVGRRKPPAEASECEREPTAGHETVEYQQNIVVNNVLPTPQLISPAAPLHPMIPFAQPPMMVPVPPQVTPYYIMPYAGKPYMVVPGHMWFSV